VDVARVKLYRRGNRLDNKTRIKGNEFMQMVGKSNMLPIRGTTKL